MRGGGEFQGGFREDRERAEREAEWEDREKAGRGQRENREKKWGAP